MPRASKSGWKWILVAGACAIALSVLSPFAGVVPVMALQFKSPEKPEITITAQKMVKDMGPASIPKLIGVLNDDKNFAADRSEAARLIGQINAGNRYKSQQAIDALVNGLRDPLIASACRHALWNIGDASVPALLKQFSSVKIKDRLNGDQMLDIANTMAGFKDSRVFDSLIQLMKDPGIGIYVRGRLAGPLVASAGSIELSGQQIHDTRRTMSALTKEIKAHPSSVYGEGLTPIPTGRDDTLRILDRAMAELDKIDVKAVLIKKR